MAYMIVDKTAYNNCKDNSLKKLITLENFTYHGNSEMTHLKNI